MAEIFGLKLFIISIYTRKIFFEIPPCGMKGIFVTKFIILSKNPAFYEAKKGDLPKKALHMEGFQTCFFLENF